MIFPGNNATKFVCHQKAFFTNHLKNFQKILNLSLLTGRVQKREFSGIL